MKKRFLLPLLLAASLVLSACANTAAPETDAILPSETQINVPAGETGGRSVTVTYKDAGFSLTLPEGWVCEEWNRFPEEASFGIDFRPADETASVSLAYSDFFGVCGTELRTEELTLNDGSNASVGYYDGKTDWDYVWFKDAPQAYSAVNHGLSGDKLQQALKILRTAVFLPAELSSAARTDWEKSVEYSYGASGVSLTMPDDWTYTVNAYEPDSFSTGFSILLHAPGGGEVRVCCDRYFEEWQSTTEDYMTLPGGWGPATVYYHDDPDRPYAVYYNNAPGVYYAYILGLAAPAQYETALEILRQIRFTEGDLRQKDAQDLVRDFTQITGSLKCSYDIASGVWTVQELSPTDNSLLREFFVNQRCEVTQR
ncbi:MAG: hypothetical protein IJT27_07015 [Clostridia bacterium]|nr:hypothetical protein [Clostridia bacterium]